MGQRTRARTRGVLVSPESYIRARQTWIGGAPYGPWSTLLNPGIVTGTFFEYCEDVVSQKPYPDNNFLLERWEGNVARAIGTSRASNSGQTEQRHDGTIIHPASHGDVESGHIMQVNPASYHNQALAKSSPSKADFSIPNFIYEAKELIPIIQDIGGRLIRSGGSYVSVFGASGIQYQFGWRPLVNDLMTILDVSKVVDKRLATLRDLADGREKKVRVKLDSQRANWLSELRYISGLNYRIRKETKIEVWGVVHHQVNIPKFSPPPRPTKLEAFQLSYLTTPSLTIWNALPWSFLVDYFVDVSSFLEAAGNRIRGFSVNRMNIMAEHKTTVHFDVEKYDQGTTGTLTIKGGPMKRTTLKRYSKYQPGAELPSLKMLSDSQATNLGLLAVAMLTR